MELLAPANRLYFGELLYANQTATDLELELDENFEPMFFSDA